ncbi:MAG: carboxypeptidase-like regulatory domain-containing protein [Bacteroidales bacterium]|nr:carboxypeptidase-like regulatory domain-containing protein [Bacteroidales bacterium]
MKYLIILASLVIAFYANSASPAVEGGKTEKAGTVKPAAVFTMTGSVIDMETGEKLAGSKIEIEESGVSIFTDINGNFSIPQLEPGNYTLKVSYISYEEKELASQIISDGKEMTISLKPL